MRPHHLAAGIALLLTALSAVPQSSESIDVRIVELQATVFDRNGKPVEGLRQEDFVVRAGRKDVAITNFFAVRSGIVASDSQPVAEANSVLETSIPTSLVIFLDDRHLTQKSHSRAIAALKRYVAEHVGANTTATLIRYRDELDVRVRPTERAGYLLRELDSVQQTAISADRSRERRRLIREIDDLLIELRDLKHPRATPEEILMQITQYAEAEASEVDATLKALERAAQIASSFTGRRILLYVSEGLPQTPALDIFEYFQKAMDRVGVELGSGRNASAGETMRYDRTNAFRRVVKTAQESGVTIFAFDAAGLRADSDRGVESQSTLGSMNTLAIEGNLRSGMQYMAGETGGQYLSRDNDIDRMLSRMSEQFSTYYSLGIRPVSGEIRVLVKNHPEYRVLSSRRAAARTREDKLEHALRSRLYTRASENPVEATLAAGTAMLKNDQCVVPIRLSVPQPQLPEELMPQVVELRMVMLNEQNDESGVQLITLPFHEGQVQHTMLIRIRPEKLVVSAAVTNPKSQETSWLQTELDGSTCR
jgi:VWFA-related protein